MSEPLPDDLLAREARRTDRALLGLTRPPRPAPVPQAEPTVLPAESVHAVPLDALSIADWSGFADAPVLEWPPKKHDGSQSLSPDSPAPPEVPESTSFFRAFDEE